MKTHIITFTTEVIIELRVDYEGSSIIAGSLSDTGEIIKSKFLEDLQNDIVVGRAGQYSIDDLSFFLNTNDFTDASKSINLRDHIDEYYASSETEISSILVIDEN